jgi:anti-repressor protein
MENSTPRQSSLTIVDDPFPVDARELHRFLQIGKDFSAWIQIILEKFMFVKDLDWIDSPLRGNQSKGRGGDRRSIEYRFTHSAAKRIQLAARGEVGDAARDGAVRLHDHVESMRAPTDDEILLRAHEILTGRCKALTERVAELEPRAAVADRLTAAKGDVSITEAARRLEMRASDLFDWLRREHVIFGDGDDVRPYADQRDLGNFVVRSVLIGRWPDGSDRIKGQTMVTPRGLGWLARKLGYDKAWPEAR